MLHHARCAPDHSHMISPYGNTFWACALYDKMAYQTHPLVNAPYTPTTTYNCRDNAKQTCHGPARYKMEWIYAKIKASGPDSLELALIMKRKERKKRKKERLRNGLFFKHLVLACTIILMNDLGLARCKICWRFWFSHLETSQNYIFWDIWVFVMYYIYGISGPSLLIESTDSMIRSTQGRGLMPDETSRFTSPSVSIQCCQRYPWQRWDKISGYSTFSRSKGHMSGQLIFWMDCMSVHSTQYIVRYRVHCSAQFI